MSEELEHWHDRAIAAESRLHEMEAAIDRFQQALERIAMWQPRSKIDDFSGLDATLMRDQACEALKNYSAT